MNHTRQELGAMTLQRLAYVLPVTLEEENLLKEVFEQRASVSSYFILTTIDVKQGWQEAILQKYIDEKRETMVPENPATLTPAEEAELDFQNITKEKELAFQAKLDAENAKKKNLAGKPKKLEVVSEPTRDMSVDPKEEAEEPVAEPKKRGRKK